MTILAFLRARLPQLADSELAGVPADYGRYARQLSRGLHEMETFNVRALRALEQIPLFSAVLANPQSVAVNTLTTIAFDTVNVDTAGWWNAATHTYTPTIAGFFRVAWSVNFHDTAAFATSTFGQVQCGNRMAIRYGNGVATGIHVTGSSLIEVDGQTGITVQGLIAAGTAPTVFASGTPYRTWLDIDYAGCRPPTG